MERRDRKRAKRAIIERAQYSDIENRTASDSKATGPRKPMKAKKGAKTKMPIGLALMYGFTATNVGTNRLTVWNLLMPISYDQYLIVVTSQLKPPTNIGVFNKGKASNKIQVNKQPLKKGGEICGCCDIKLKGICIQVVGVQCSQNWGS